jgi:outer membrane protein OmpA-like peptidoglycan-associated protein
MPQDHDLISSQTHELNYLLKKWEKKQNRKNREILRETLKKFRTDKSYKPHKRDNFYAYVKDNDILALLEDVENLKAAGRKTIMPDVETDDVTIDGPYIRKAGKKKAKLPKIKKQKIQIQDLARKKTTGNIPGRKISGKTGMKTSGISATEFKERLTLLQSGSAGRKPGSRKSLLLILIIILAVVLVIVLISVGTCIYRNAQAEKTDFSPEDKGIQPVDTEDKGVTSDTERENYTGETLKSFLLTCTPIYFKGDLDEFETGEKQKIEKLASYLDHYDSVELVIHGHTADTGQPENEVKLSIARADHVAALLKRNTEKVKLTIKTRGYGSTLEAVPNPRKEKMRLNRRVEITVVKAESD